MRILAIGAHPDDIALGCGGTLAKHEARGDKIYQASLSSGRDDPIDQKFETLPLVDIIFWVDSIIAKYKPDIIYTHCASDINRDHRIVNEAVMVATRPPCAVRELYTFDVTSDWGFAQFGTFRPNTFVKITDTIEEKIKAMETYADEVQDYPFYRSFWKIRALAQRWGSIIGVAYAEAFELIRWIK